MTVMTPKNIVRSGAFVLGWATASTLMAGTAYAVWTASGTGTGAGSASTFQAVTVSAGTAPAGQLYPGGTNVGDLVLTASNPNPFAVTVTLSQNGAPTGCTTTGVTLSGTPSFTLPAGASNVPTTLSGVLSMDNTSSNDCQGATITVPLTTSAASS